MSLREYEQFHGAALLKTISAAGGEAQVVLRPDIGSGCYGVNGVGLIFKYAKDRLSPWHFTFTADHRWLLDQLGQEYSVAGTILVCNTDGIVVLSAADVETVLGPCPASGAVGVARRPRGMALVTGPCGDLPRKVAQADFSVLYR